ncbi:uncharacterized protein PG986_011644 [Apiospora aurea]|uniref:Uncharacterized protein n=1 Tax=Apiospora aurea TaxID=335848 RepID=A0ABR1PYS8_9PEZI
MVIICEIFALLLGSTSRVEELLDTNPARLRNLPSRYDGTLAFIPETLPEQQAIEGAPDDTQHASASGLWDLGGLQKRIASPVDGLLAAPHTDGPTVRYPRRDLGHRPISNKDLALEVQGRDKPLGPPSFEHERRHDHSGHAASVCCESDRAHRIVTRRLRAWERARRGRQKLADDAWLGGDGGDVAVCYESESVRRGGACCNAFIRRRDAQAHGPLVVSLGPCGRCFAASFESDFNGHKVPANGQDELYVDAPLEQIPLSFHEGLDGVEEAPCGLQLSHEGVEIAVRRTLTAYGLEAIDILSVLLRAGLWEIWPV